MKCPVPTERLEALRDRWSAWAEELYLAGGVGEVRMAVREVLRQAKELRPYATSNKKWLECVIFAWVYLDFLRQLREADQ